MESLVLLPGWTKDGNSYQKLVKLAPSGIKIFIPSYDFLAPNKGLTYFENQLLNYLKKNNLDKVHLAGHSLGGTLAAYFAYKHPEKLKNLYLVDSEIFPEKFSKRFSRFAKEHGRRSLYSNLKAFVILLKNPVLNLRIAITACNLDLENEVKDIGVPTYLIWGTKDTITPVAEAKRIQKLIKNSKTILLKDVDHDWVLNNPEHLLKNVVF